MKNQNGYTYSYRYTYNWKKRLKNHLTINSIWNCVIHCISPWLSFDTSFYHISVFLSKIFHFQNYIFYIILHLLVIFLLKYDILFLTSYITKFLTHVYYTYYNIIILTIPEWLNNEALRLNLNFSQVLQEALLTKIQSHWTIILLFIFYTTHHLWNIWKGF